MGQLNYLPFLIIILADLAIAELVAFIIWKKTSKRKTWIFVISTIIMAILLAIINVAIWQDLINLLEKIIFINQLLMLGFIVGLDIYVLTKFAKERKSGFWLITVAKTMIIFSASLWLIYNLLK